MVMEEETNGELLSNHVENGHDVVVVETNDMEGAVATASEEETDDSEATPVEKDEQTLFDEMNMRRAIQLVVEK